MNPQVKTGLTHLGTAVGGAVAVLAFVSEHKVDLYAVWDQLNVVIAAITQLVAIAAPIATTIYGIYRTSTKARVAELATDPLVKGVVTVPELATSIKNDKVQGTAGELPPAAKV